MTHAEMLAERYPHEYGEKPKPSEHTWGTNFLGSIEARLGGEPVEAWACGGHDGRFSNHERFERCEHGVLLDWESTKSALDYIYDATLGGTGCNAVYIWTATRVLFVSWYDDATCIETLPRNPAACLPGYVE